MTAPSTENRIYAQRVLREIRRRESLGAAAFRAKTWEHGPVDLLRRAIEDPQGVFTRNAITMTERRLRGLPEADRGFLITHDAFDLMTLSAGGHTLTAMESLEEAVLVQRHCFLPRYLCAGMMMANVSVHTLARFRERACREVTVDDGLSLALVCGHIGMLASSQRHLCQSELNLAADGCVITGSMKIASYANSRDATAFFDVRTALPESACTDAQMQQAFALKLCIEGKITIADVPALARRQDFVLKTLEASKK